MTLISNLPFFPFIGFRTEIPPHLFLRGFLANICQHLIAIVNGGVSTTVKTKTIVNDHENHENQGHVVKSSHLLVGELGRSCCEEESPFDFVFVRLSLP